MKILQVEVESLLIVKVLIGNRRLELPVRFYADMFKSAVARLCRIADVHFLGLMFGHVSPRRWGSTTSIAMV